MKKIIVLMFVLLGSGCYSKSTVAKIGVAGFFAGRIDARNGIQNYISDNKTLTGWESSGLNHQIIFKNIDDDARLITLTGKSYDEWKKKFEELKNE
jgi:hypothetical protein